MNPQETIEIEIERMSFGPASVGRYTPAGEARAMVVFVHGATPGERVRARLLRNHKNYWEAELVETLKPSSERATPPCGVYGKCGGCQWQHLTYPAQLKAKEEILTHQLHRGAHLELADIKSKLKVHGAQNPFGYRTRVQLHGDKNGIGFFAAGSHEIVHTENCPIAHPDIQKAWTKFLQTRPLAELAKATGQFKIEWTRTESGQLLEAYNRKHGALGFTQINPEQNKVLVELVETLATSNTTPKGVAMDLYGGDGNLSHQLVNKFEHILSVDTFNTGADPVSVEKPLQAGRTFIKESVESFLVNQRWRDWGFENIDCVIVDPPRTGLREVAKLVSELGASRLVLVSCDPSTLARDLNSILPHYQVDAVHLVDMFPQTYHIETVIVLQRTPR